MNDSSFVQLADCDDYLYASLNDGARSSGDSSEGFTFLSSSNPRRNLTSKFEEQATKPSLASVASTASTARSSSMASASSQSVFHTIAHFEAKAQAQITTMAKAPQAARPPLPLRQQSKIPSNRLATYLRIRPPSEASAPASAAPTASGTSTCSGTYGSTIEVVKPHQPNSHPTTVRTYAPIQSNASKIHSHRQQAEEIQAQSHAKQFEFHQVLTPETNQQTVYNMVATPLLQGILETTFQTDSRSTESAKNLKPQSALLFSYGITNAGKTYTILGDLKEKNDANCKWGIIPRAINDILDRIHRFPKRMGSVDLYLSFFEVYNEQIHDLLPKKSDSKNLGLPPPNLKVGERQGQTIVRGLTKHKIDNVQHGIELILAANNRRHTSSNNLNNNSSRSHCICQLQLVPRPPTQDDNTIQSNLKDDDTIVSMNGYSTEEEVNHTANKRIATIWIVDLAGSERSKRTQMGSSRQKEASQINKSLMTLMRCLTIMREGSRSSSIVPFRESKLTHVFMGHLTGPSAWRTAMIVNVNPSISDFDETQHVLAYAASTRLIQLDPMELQQKRKKYYDNEYSMDGHKKKQSVFSKVVQGLKMLSPKKRPLGNQEKPKQVVLNAKKSLAMIGSEQPLAKEVTKEESEPLPKRARAGPNDPGRSFPQIAEVNLEAELKATREALAQATVEITRLRSEKEELIEELANQETHIRIEVSKEMEERLRVARDRHRQEVERLRSLLQSSQAPLPSTRQAQLDHADKHIQDLMDKVDVCEEEIARMREEHQNEIDKLKKQHTAEVSALQAQLEGTSTESSKRVTDMEQELEASRNQIERLKKMKLDLVENYEKLLRKAKNDTNEDSRGSDEEEDDDSQSENSAPLWKQKLTRVGNKNRKILGNVSSNTESTA